MSIGGAGKMGAALTMDRSGFSCESSIPAKPY